MWPPARAIAVVWFCSPAVAAQWVQPTVTVWNRPGFDWHNASYCGPFVAAGGDALARQRTRLAFSRDGGDLYVGVIASRRAPATPRAVPPNASSRRSRPDDRVSVYFKLDDHIYEFSMAGDGSLDEVRWTSGRRDPGWTAAAEWRVQRPAEWRGRLKVPLVGLGLKRVSAGESLSFAAVRRLKTGAQVSGWPGCRRSDAPPILWGRLVFLGEKAAHVTDFRCAPPGPGPGMLRWLVRPESVNCLARILIGTGGEPEPLAADFGQRRKDGWRVCRYELPPAGRVQMQAILTAGDQVLHATAVMPVTIPPPFETIKELRASIRDVRAKSDQISQAGPRGWFDYSIMMLEYETRAAEKATKKAMVKPPSEQRNAALRYLDDQVEKLLWRARLASGRLKALTSGGAGDAFAVGTAHSLRKLRRYAWDVYFGRPLRLRCARREAESGQLLIVPFDTELEKVTVSWTDLAGGLGATLSKDHITVDLVGFVRTARPDYDVDHVGWWPDPLIPLNGPFRVARYQSQPLWLTVHADMTIPAGRYQGLVTVADEDLGEVAVPLEVEVLDYELPRRGKLQTVFGFDWPADPSGLPRKRARRIWDMTLAHRIYAGGLSCPTPQPGRADLDFCLRRGLNSYLLVLPPIQGLDERLGRLNAVCDVLRGRGLMQIAFLCGWWGRPEKRSVVPELTPQQWQALAKQVPDLKRCGLCRDPSTMDASLLDVVVLATTKIPGGGLGQERPDQGRTAGAYLEPGTRHPYANFLIDYPAIDHRVLFWQLWDRQVRFFLYETISGQSRGVPNRPDGTAGSWAAVGFSGANGEGQLVYPTGNGVLPSIRLANIRDGIEDYEALGVLADLTAALDPSRHADLIEQNKKILAAAREVARSMADFTKDPEVLLRARRRLDRQILKTKQVAGAG